MLDRETGEFIHAFRTGFDNLITGWSDEGRPSINPDLIPTREDVDSGRVFEVCPHLHGTRNLNSPSYSPVTGLYYLGTQQQLHGCHFRHRRVRGRRTILGCGNKAETGA